ncbi:hypothetical protein KDK95_33220 [Actinospica sp. MGRD01-02]|uniref:DeoxyPurine in DNA protein A domain-containing protein n=1 Tax=Actinospica acidithermotolerans TaxID=2828514 RepID=A0A941EEI0_9ACTN|nr:hypothetical protein [Actinospica acidithermotolerans]MBR7831215.1 hypothetical protein [Actinospica acidithermotolerans]
MSAPTFYLGLHHPRWVEQVDFPVCLSHVALSRYKRECPRLGDGASWILDSGAYSQLSGFGKFLSSPQQYAEAALRYVEEVGRPDFISPQDWMTEPEVLAATGLTVREHQERTIASYLTLLELLPGQPVIPVLQGNSLTSYLDCLAGYRAAGIDLAALPRVGVGSVCRLQATGKIGEIATALAGDQGLAIHGYGVKSKAFENGYAPLFASTDSMAWSTRGRHVSGCAHGRRAKSEGGCLQFAIAWRTALLAKLHPDENPPT